MNDFINFREAVKARFPTTNERDLANLAREYAHSIDEDIRWKLLHLHYEDDRVYPIWGSW